MPCSPEIVPFKESSQEAPLIESAMSEIEEHPPISEEHQEELEVEHLENYATLTKEQLVARIEELSEVPEFNAVKSKVFAVRDAFNHIASEEKATALSKFLEDGGLKEEFDFKSDALEDRFNEALKKHNKKVGGKLSITEEGYNILEPTIRIFEEKVKV